MEDFQQDDRDYRAYVGPAADYDRMAAIQVSLLLAAGLRENHNVLDVGCGSLRGGRMLIPYLLPGRYFGIDPNRSLVQEGIENELGHDAIRLKQPTFRYADDFSVGEFGVAFDFVLAQSIFSHTHPDLALKSFRNIAGALSTNGWLFATYVNGSGRKEGSGWVYRSYQGGVPYPWEEMRGLLEEAGMVARPLRWPHPRQKWFVAALPESEGEVDDFAQRLRPALRRRKK